MYKSMYAIALKSSGMKLNATELCQQLCNTLQQVGQLQQQMNVDRQQTASLDASGT